MVHLANLKDAGSSPIGNTSSILKWSTKYYAPHHLCVGLRTPLGRPHRRASSPRIGFEPLICQSNSQQLHTRAFEILWQWNPLLCYVYKCYGQLSCGTRIFRRQYYYHEHRYLEYCPKQASDPKLRLQLHFFWVDLLKLLRKLFLVGARCVLHMNELESETDDVLHVFIAMQVLIGADEKSSLTRAQMVYCIITAKHSVLTCL